MGKEYGLQCPERGVGMSAVHSLPLLRYGGSRYSSPLHLEYTVTIGPLHARTHTHTHTPQKAPPSSGSVPPLSAWNPRAPPQTSSRIIPPFIPQTLRLSRRPHRVLSHYSSRSVVLSSPSGFPIISVPLHCQSWTPHVFLEHCLTPCPA